MKTLRELLDESKRILLDAGIENSEYDSFALLEYEFNISRSEYFMDQERLAYETDYLSKIYKRAKHYPLQYIIGEQWFMGLPFKVDERVLIPRQDTEVLVERAIKYIGNKPLDVLDMCTGSGCIAISIDKFCEKAKVSAADISKDALDLARTNAKLNDAKVEFYESNIFDNISDTYDIIISNPPYIESRVIDTLMPEVKDYEPILALDGTDDGLEFYRKISMKAKDFLNKNGCIMYEIGCNQADDVSRLLEKNGFGNIEVIKDLAGHNRVVTAKLL